MVTGIAKEREEIKKKKKKKNESRLPIEAPAQLSGASFVSCGSRKTRDTCPMLDDAASTCAGGQSKARRGEQASEKGG